MDSLINWLREEREVLKSSPIICLVLIVFGFLFGGAVTAALRESEIGNLRSAVSAADSQRDLWRDKYAELASGQPAIGHTRAVRPSEPRISTAGSTEIDWPRSGMLLAAIVAICLALLFFFPLPKAVQKESVKVLADQGPAEAVVLPRIFEAENRVAIPTLPAPGPDLFAWNLIQTVSLAQAAYLWADLEPPTRITTDLPGVVLAKFLILLDAARRKTLDIDGDAITASHGNSVSVLNYVGPIQRDQLFIPVTRDALQRFSESIGQKPPFLFERALVPVPKAKNPLYAIWDPIDPLELYQAACLWNDEAPPCAFH